MKILLSKSNDIYKNLAIEEAIARNSLINDDVIFLYQNSPAIVLGLNQNAYAEINKNYTSKSGIKISRRLSGGGAVYHDLGNVCFSFIENKKNKKHTFHDFLEPIISFLQLIGLDATFSGKNDITIDNYKISGNAQYLTPYKIVHHGTLLYNTDLTMLTKSLKPNIVKLQAKGIQSNQQQVINIKELMKQNLSTNQFINELHMFLKSSTKSSDLFLNSKMQTIIKKYEERNSEWEWIYGRSWEAEIENKVYLPSLGYINTMININRGKIVNLKIYGDYLATKNHKKIIMPLIGIKYSYNEIHNYLESIINFNDYFGGLTASDLTCVILGNKESND